MANKKVLYFGVFLLLLGFIHAESSFNPTQTLNQMLDGYDKRLRPNWGGTPVEIGITMYFLRIYDISTKAETVTSDAYFRQTWTDPRLNFSAPEGFDHFVFGAEDMKKFWQPDTFLARGIAKFAHDSNTFFRIKKDGSILASVRVLANTPFPMNLKYFPADKQTFSYELESYGYSAKDVTYKWAKGNSSVGLSEECGTPEMRINSHRMVNSLIHLSTGSYSRLIIEFDTSRNSGYFCRHFYWPAIISFLLVWSTFWFPVSSSAIRILLTLAAFLTNNFLMTKTGKYLPTLGYSTMLETYMSFNMAMAALSIIPLALVVYLHGKAKKVQVGLGGDLESSLLEGDSKLPLKGTEDGKETKSLSSYFSRSAQYVMTIRQHRRSYQKVDLAFRILYPTIFIIFNIWYWVSFP